MAVNITTLIAEKDWVAAVGTKLQLVVVGPDLFTTYDLPEEGELVIGRGEGTDVRLSDAFTSRQHARLSSAAGRHFIEDLGSANGTRVRQATIPPHQKVEIAIGETVSMGSTIVVLQPAQATRRSWPMQTPRTFEIALDEVCARAAAAKTTFSVVFLRVLDGFLGDRLAEVAHGVLRADDLLASYGPTDYALLLERPSAEEVAALVQGLEAELRGGGTSVATGMASFPWDGRRGAELLAHARKPVKQGGAIETGGLAVVVQDVKMRRLYELAQHAAAGTVNVLVLGETGVGKDVMARMIHRLSPRADKPFLRIDCASLSGSLLESELFGHERGAFTGATQAKPGLIESAPGGTVFLDEIGELPLPLQAKLLCVLETREVTRVGALKGRPVDVRFVAATNRSLEKEVAEGRFRKDLYFRLNGFSLYIPPLRERRSEIAFLARAVLWQICSKLERVTQPVLSADAVGQLESYAWPGNVRELRNVMERGVLLCRGDELRPEHLLFETAGPETPEPAPGVPFAVGAAPTGSRPAASGDDRTEDNASGIRRGRDDAAERRLIEDALSACGGNQSRAAKRLGMPRSTFVLRLDEYGITRPRKPAPGPGGNEG